MANSKSEIRNPSVSVVIPAYNRAPCIGEAIESVVAQETPFSFEIVVVDDGSTDDTAKVARSYGNLVRVITKENGGPASARNAGVLAARSGLIAFLDSDDLMLPGRLVRQSAFMRAHPEIIVSFGDIISDTHPGKSYLKTVQELPFEPGEWLTVEKPYQRLLTRGNFVPNQTTMLRRDDYVRAGMMDESLWVSEDLELWSRLSLRGNFAYFCGPFARVRRQLNDNLMFSSYAFTDIARARHKMMLRDRVLTEPERRESLALLRKFHRRMLRYDLRERGRRQMLRDLRETGVWFGRWYFFRWWLVSLIPQPLPKFVNRLRHRRG
jgi:glycosyltransferase involved in cell wall biosynthesis